MIKMDRIKTSLPLTWSLFLLVSLPVIATRQYKNGQVQRIFKMRQPDQANGHHFHNSTTSSSSTTILWRPINFISPSESLSQTHWFNDAPSFSAKGMDHLYMITEYILNWIQPSGLPSDVIDDQVFDDPEKVLNQHRGQLLTHFWGLLLTATICICVAVVVPLSGFLICCCLCGSGSSKRAKYHHHHDHFSSSPGRHRHRHSRRRYKVDSACDPCCRSFFGVNLFILLLLISFFVISAFVTNEYLKSGLHELPKTVNKSVDDVILYLNKTQHEIDILLGTNYQQLYQELSNSLDRSGLIVKNRLAQVSRASSLENLTEIVNKLDSVLKDLRLLSLETTELKLLLHQLHTRLIRSRKDLEVFFEKCADRICHDLKRRYHHVLNTFSVSNRIDELPDLNPLMDHITELLKRDIVLEVRKGKDAFDELSLKIQSTVNNTIPAIKEQIRAVGKELNRAADDINEGLRRPFNDLYAVKRHANTGLGLVNEYEIYRWYSFIGAVGVLFMIFSFYTCGLFYGACKDQPTRHNYRRRSKTSSTFFRCGIALTFLLFGPLLLACIGLFLVGGVSDKVLCYYMENLQKPQTRQLVAVLQKRFENYNNEHPVADSINIYEGMKPNIADVLSRCHQNMSLYNVLQLNKYNHIRLNNRVIQGFNISAILTFKERYRIEERLQTFLNQVNVNPSNVVLMTQQAYELLESLKRTSLSTLNFSSYAEVVKNSITPLDLVSISNELEEEANRLPKSDVENVARLRNIAMDLKSLVTLVVQIKNSIDKLTEGAEKVERKAHYGNLTLKEAISDLLAQAERAQHFITEKGYQEIRSVANSFVSDMSALVDQYAQHVVEEVNNGIGRCEPVSRAVNASVTSLCKEVVLPLNGYCFSLAFALFLSIPSTLFACILSRLYQKVKRHRSRRESSDSTLDNVDDDDIPLAHVDSKNNLTTPFDPRSVLYADRSASTAAAPSAPVPSSDDNWSPGAPPPHHFGNRPPPYNFAN